MSELEVSLALQQLGCPLLDNLDIEGNLDWVTSLLLSPGEERTKLLDWVLGLGSDTEMSLETWLLHTATATQHKDRQSFIAGTMCRKQQLQLWSHILVLLSCPIAGDLEDPYPGVLEDLAEAVSLTRQERSQDLEITPFHLARETKETRARRADTGTDVPSIRKVRTFLEEAGNKREELGQTDGLQLVEDVEDIQGLRELTERVDTEARRFGTKYQGELKKWLPLTQQQPKKRPEIGQASEVVERMGDYLKDNTTIASAATRLAASGDQLQNNLSVSVSSLASYLESLHTIQAHTTNTSPQILS